MREILFRGKRLDDGGWVYGCYYLDETTARRQTFIVVNDFGFILVIPESVGQYTGLKDKNGKKIFEGDIIKDKEPRRIYMIGYNEDLMKYAFLYYHKELKNIYCGGFVSKTDGKSIEVIGNIFDNPEFLGVEK